jgi:hypothetical protein
VVAAARGEEICDNAVALGGCGVDRDEVVVVKVDAPGARLREHRDGVNRPQRVADGVSERVAPAVADGPQAERESVFRTRRV